MKKSFAKKIPSLFGNGSRVRVGILGGGQLARMLCLAGAPLGLECHVLSSHSEDPAAQVTGFWHPGDFKDPKHLRAFAKQVDVLTFESEFIEASTLAKALKGLKLKTFPSVHCLGLLQDRLTQKQTLEKFKINTLPFRAVTTVQDLEYAFAQFKGKFVLKMRKNGYDGYGTFYCQKPGDLAALKTLIQPGATFIAEEFTSFKRECALMIFRSQDKSLALFPLVTTEQKNSRCDWVMGPTQHPALKGLLSRLKKMLHDLDYVGALGIELFDTGSALVVNELAPRVHNSGHFSQNALMQDQFALHFKAGLGEKIQSPAALTPAFAMANLIGSHHQPAALAATTAALHWYGKTENRPGRKMGHLNLCGTHPKAVLKTLLGERKKFNL